jgi:dihydropteroate synthase
VSEICDFLRQRIDRCVEAGIAADRIVIDPGFGFGKTAAHNFTLLKQLQRVADLGYPVLAGLSRKSMIAHVIQRDPTERLAASLSLAVLAAMNGARLLRVHDVRETVDALAMLTAMENIN